METGLSAPAVMPDRAGLSRPLKPTPWIVSAPFDLLLLSNLLWPLLLLPGLISANQSGPVDFVQIYFLTTPHRWITLLLVLLDPDRREGKDDLFLVLALAVALSVLAVYVVAGGFLCLLLIDFIWNAWHFGSQHAGVLRIYGRKAGSTYSWFEKHGLRLFITYSILRIPDWSTSWMIPSWRGGVRLVDFAFLCIPILLLARAALRRRREEQGKTIYLISVCSLYGLMLGIRDVAKPDLLAAFFLAASVFHATEYLAIVSHYANGRSTRGAEGAFQTLARTWGLVLLAFILILGTVDFLLQRSAFELAAGLNLTAAFLHYAFDGMIWKLRRPSTARSLGV